MKYNKENQQYIIHPKTSELVTNSNAKLVSTDDKTNR